jgi:hypothetical protein
MEKKFVETQDQRRDLQMGMTDIQSKLKSIHSELEKTHRGEEKYLILVTEVRFEIISLEGSRLQLLFLSRNTTFCKKSETC